MSNMNNRVIRLVSRAEYLYFRDSIFYTEDRIPVERLNFFKVPPEMREDALKAYFLKFGNVLELRMVKDLKKEFETCLSGDVLFANAEDAAIALECRPPNFDGMEIEVEPSYSWLQPDAYGPPEEDQQQDLGPIWKLNDYCWINILQYLGMRDKVRFARSCQRFRAIYQMATAGQYKSGLIKFSQMTLWDIRDFCQMSGDQVLQLLCARHSRYDEIVELVTVYCRNLIFLALIREVPTTNTMLKMPLSIENLIFMECGELEDFPIICKHFSKLSKLTLSGTKVSGPNWSSIVKNNYLPSLEGLRLILYEKCGILAQLPKLKRLGIYIHEIQDGVDMIDQLVKHKANQLEELLILGKIQFKDIRQLAQIAKLTGLRKLHLDIRFHMTGNILKEFVGLKELEKVSFMCLTRVSNSAILDFFIGCPKLSYLQTRYTPQPACDLVLMIVAQVRREMTNNEIHRELPVELVLDIDHKDMKELIQNNPETLTEDIIKIKSSIPKRK